VRPNVIHPSPTNSDKMEMPRQPTQSTIAEPALIPEKVLQFMSSLPTTGDTVEWIYQFREGLQSLLGDVDRIAICINVGCELTATRRSKQHFDIAQHARFSAADRHLPVIRSDSEESISSQLIEDWRRLGRPLDDYHHPHCYDYYSVAGVHLASILLFRRRTLPPTSNRTLQTIEALKPFLIFVLSGHIARHHYKQPVDRLFTKVVGTTHVSAKLTERETHVLALRLMGLSYAEIARQLFISENTVAKHVKSAHRKTGCESFLELFAPYFREATGENGA
jgi:DNA-binding CsgD family transcriptional regulator